jgi:hypothetical protein
MGDVGGAGAVRKKSLAWAKVSSARASAKHHAFERALFEAAAEDVEAAAALLSALMCFVDANTN